MDCQSWLIDIANQELLSARAVSRVVKVARTIADLSTSNGYQKSTSPKQSATEYIGGDSMIWNLWMTTIIVDQIQDDVAVIEWENEALSIIDTIWLPTSVEEGDVLIMELERVPLSNCKLRPVAERPSSAGWLSCDGLDPIYLPIKTTLERKNGCVLEYHICRSRIIFQQMCELKLHVSRRDCILNVYLLTGQA